MKKAILVSYPRSGRHMMQDLVRAGSDLRICGEKEHNPTDEIDIVVSHDCLERNKWTDRVLLVFVRDPFESIASWYKLDVLGKEGKEDTFDTFETFVKDRAIPYWVCFVEEYLMPTVVEQPAFIISYRKFVANPELGLDRINKILDASIDVDKALTRVPVKLRNNHKTFKHYDPSVDPRAIRMIVEMKRALGPYPLILHSMGVI